MADRFDRLDPALQTRIRRSLIISSVWFGMIVASAGVFMLSKTYIDRRREERRKQLNYKPLVTVPKPPPPREN